ncbi:FecR domain-containing protein [Sphingomonas sp. DT-207]|uniref:FecR family protein n=1 Tax=Sphingomonas sp. DT-207 TaxID=3396167 RepID=UPI003F1B64B9
MPVDALRGSRLPGSAEGWFALLRGAASAEERAAFERWRAEPGNARACARLEQAWDRSMFLAHSKVALDRDLSRAASRIPHGWAAAEGILLLLLTAGGFAAFHAVWQGKLAGASPERAVAEGGVRSLRLSDGSRVTLDRHSAIEIRLAARERRLRLLRGRARFDVAPDSTRPFVVEAGSGSVVAIGALFERTPRP